MKNYGNILTQVTIRWYLTKLFEVFTLIVYNYSRNPVIWHNLRQYYLFEKKIVDERLNSVFNRKAFRKYILN